MSPSVEVEGETDRPDPPAWWDDAEAFVVLGRGLRVPKHTYEAATGETLSDDASAVVYTAGDALPEGLTTPRLWEAFGDRLAAMDAGGERLDRPANAERRGDIDDEGVKVWRREQGLVRRTVEVFACDECGKRFQNQAALAGHMSSHTGGSEPDADADPDPDPERDADPETAETEATAGGDA